jgi:HSP20 family protein
MRIAIPTLRGRELAPFEGFSREFDEMMKEFGRPWPAMWSSKPDRSALAPLDVAETQEAVEIATELPGMGEEDVTVTVEGQSVVIAGEKKTQSETTEKDWHVVERSYGSFRRVVPLTFLPDAAAIKATFDKGVLHVKVAKPAAMVEKKFAIPIGKAS